MNNQRPNSPVQVPEEAAIGLAEVLAEDITEQPLVPTIRQQKPEKPETFSFGTQQLRQDYMSPYADRKIFGSTDNTKYFRDPKQQWYTSEIKGSDIELVRDYRDEIGYADFNEALDTDGNLSYGWITNFDKEGMSPAQIRKEIRQRTNYETKRFTAAADDIMAAIQNPDTPFYKKDQVITKEKLASIINFLPEDDPRYTPENLYSYLLKEGYTIEGFNTLSAKEVFSSALQNIDRPAWGESSALFTPDTWAGLGQLTLEAGAAPFLAPVYGLVDEPPPTPLMDSIVDFYSTTYDFTSTVGLEGLKRYIAEEPVAFISDIATLFSLMAGGTAKIATVVPRLGLTKHVPLIRKVQKGAELLDITNLATYGAGKALKGLGQVPILAATFYSGKPKLMFEEALYGPSAKGKKSLFRAAKKGEISERRYFDMVTSGMEKIRADRNKEYGDFMDRMTVMGTSLDLTPVKNKLSELLKDYFKIQDKHGNPTDPRIPVNPQFKWMMKKQQDLYPDPTTKLTKTQQRDHTIARIQGFREMIDDLERNPVTAYPDEIQTQVESLRHILAAKFEDQLGSPNFPKADKIIREVFDYDISNLRLWLSQMEYDAGLKPSPSTMKNGKNTSDVIRQAADFKKYSENLEDLVSDTGVSNDAVVNAMENRRLDYPDPDEFTGDFFQYGTYMPYVLDWSRSHIIDQASQKKIEKVIRDIDSWGQRPGGQDYTPAMVDVLKRRLDKFWDPDGDGRAMVTELRGTVYDILDKGVPEYKARTKSYEIMTEFINENRKTLGIDPNKKLAPRTVDQVLRKAKTILKEDEVIRRDLVDQVANASKEDLIGVIAGISAKDWRPARYTPFFLTGSAAKWVLGSYMGFLVPLLFMSPAVTTEILNSVGYTAAGVKKLRDAMERTPIGQSVQGQRVLKQMTKMIAKTPARKERRQEQETKRRQQVSPREQSALQELLRTLQ